MRFIGSMLAIFAVALLTGCATGPGAPVFFARHDEANEVAAMLANYRRGVALPAESQQRELAAAQIEYDKAANDGTRLTLALAMLLPQVPVHDDMRVLTLLAEIGPPKSGKASPRHDLAQSLMVLVAERVRALREEQRKAEQLNIQLREERRKTVDMQQKIDSLRAIDRDLRQRRGAQ